jgi:hypothetical protein
VPGRAAVVDLGDDRLGAAGGVDDDEVALGDRAQRDRVGGIAVGDPEPAVALMLQDTLVAQIAQHLAEILGAEGLAVAKRQLEGGAAHMVHEDQELIRVDARVLRAMRRRRTRDGASCIDRARRWSRPSRPGWA